MLISEIPSWLKNSELYLSLEEEDEDINFQYVIDEPNVNTLENAMLTFLTCTYWGSKFPSILIKYMIETDNELFFEELIDKDINYSYIFDLIALLRSDKIIDQNYSINNDSIIKLSLKKDVVNLKNKDILNDILEYFEKYGIICFYYAIIFDCYDYIYKNLNRMSKKNYKYCMYAALNNNLPLLKLFHENEFISTYQTIKSACYNDSLECLKYALENNFDRGYLFQIFQDDIFSECVISNKNRIFLYLKDNVSYGLTSNFYSDKFLDMAVENNNINVVEYIIKHIIENGFNNQHYLVSVKSKEMLNLLLGSKKLLKKLYINVEELFATFTLDEYLYYYDNKILRVNIDNKNLTLNDMLNYDLQISNFEILFSACVENGNIDLIRYFYDVKKYLVSYDFTVFYRRIKKFNFKALEFLTFNTFYREQIVNLFISDNFTKIHNLIPVYNLIHSLGFYINPNDILEKIILNDDVQFLSSLIENKLLKPDDCFSQIFYNSSILCFEYLMTLNFNKVIDSNKIELEFKDFVNGSFLDKFKLKKFDSDFIKCCKILYKNDIKFDVKNILTNYLSKCSIDFIIFCIEYNLKIPDHIETNIFDDIISENLENLEISEELIKETDVGRNENSKQIFLLLNSHGCIIKTSKHKKFNFGLFISELSRTPT